MDLRLEYEGFVEALLTLRLPEDASLLLAMHASGVV